MDPINEEPPPSYGAVISNPDDYSANYQATSCSAPLLDQTNGVQFAPAYGTYPSLHEVPVASIVTLGRHSVACICPHCYSYVMTHVKYKSGLLVWFCVLILILMGCILGCCLIPFCISNIKNIRHYCPRCKKLLGEYHPL